MRTERQIRTHLSFQVLEKEILYNILFFKLISGISKQRFKAKASGDQEEAYKATADITDYISRQQVYEQNWPAVLQMIR